MRQKRNQHLFGVLLSCMLLFLSFSNLYAEASEEEFAIYQRYFVVMGAEAQYTQMLDIMLGQFQQGFAAGAQRAAENSSKLPQVEEHRIQEILQSSLAQYLQQLRQIITELMPFDTLVKDVYYPIYSQYFTVEEIQEMTAFFETPVGKKFVATTPNLMQESVVLINQKYSPDIRKRSRDIAEEEFGKIQAALEEMFSQE